MKEQRIRFEGGKLLDPQSGECYTTNLTVNQSTGKIDAIGSAEEADQVVQLDGQLILPGFIDMHVHLRDPGFTDKENLATGLHSAAAGGFTQVACMPNTKPPIDNRSVVEDVITRSRDARKSTVHPIACITVAQQGVELTDFEQLQLGGAVALSDDGKGVQHGSLMIEAMTRATRYGLPIVIHSEDESLSLDGVIHTDAAKRLGLKGIPVEAESAMVARDVLLAEKTGAHLHVCHVSTEQSVAIIRWAKARGIRVTAEVTPHHLLLNETLIQSNDAVYKVNPPLQTERDREACLEGFLDGTLDIIATDHAPHTAAEKSLGIEKAPFGMVGLETAFPLLYTELVKKGIVSLKRLVEAMTYQPAHLFGLEGGVIRPGAVADLAIVDVDNYRTIDPTNFYSKGRNTPFEGFNVTGWTTRTIHRGETIFIAGEERLV